MSEEKITTVLKTNNGEVTLTWMRTDRPEQFTPYFQVYGIVFNDAEEILLIQENGKWKIPGGTPESGETAVETLKRELLEEADVEISEAWPLGVQRVDFPNNPNTREGDLFFQYRFVCRAGRLLDQTPDPASGVIHPRMFAPASKVTDYVQWGEVGSAMFHDAIELFRERVGRLD